MQFAKLHSAFVWSALTLTAMSTTSVSSARAEPTRETDLPVMTGKMPAPQRPVSQRLDSQRPRPHSIRDARILVPADQPRFVSRAVEDLQKVVSEFSGPERFNPSGVRESGAGLIIELAIDAGLEVPEAFHIRSDRHENGLPVVTVCGTDSAGLKFGVIELISALQVTPDDVLLPLPLEIRRKPLVATRSMYAHLHWAYHHPYALRSWRIDDWKRYIDLLTHLGFNTIQIWPMMELLPHPLSVEDRAYLQRYAEIVEYAHTERGMKVFIGSCPNSIAEDSRGVPIEERDYWQFEQRIDPGSPEGLRRILEARGDLYRTVPNADGYWVIDSDPGGWPGSPVSDFVAILAGHRRLIDEHGVRPHEQSLIYWMWYGWGTGSHVENWRDTLNGLKQRVGEPWMLHVCLPEQLPVCRELALLDRAIWFPYNLVETEPSAPLTELRFERIEESLDIAFEAGLGAVQGNAQTPLLQLPNLARLSDCAWHDTRGWNAEATLRRLAAKLVSRDEQVVVEAWQSLSGTDAAEAMMLADRLRRLAADKTARGGLSPILGDWQPRVLEDLSCLLEIHAAALRFGTAVDRHARRRELTSSLRNYLTLLVAWLERTGYHNDRIVTHAAYKQPVSEGLARLEPLLGPDRLRAEVLEPASRWADDEPSVGICRLVIETLLGRRK